MKEVYNQFVVSGTSFAQDPIVLEEIGTTSTGKTFFISSNSSEVILSKKKMQTSNTTDRFQIWNNWYFEYLNNCNRPLGVGCQLNIIWQLSYQAKAIVLLQSNQMRKLFYWTLTFEEYMVIYCIIILSHLLILEFKYNLLKETYLLLKPFGWVELQLGAPDRPRYLKEDGWLQGLYLSINILIFIPDLQFIPVTLWLGKCAWLDNTNLSIIFRPFFGDFDNAWKINDSYFSG